MSRKNIAARTSKRPRTNDSFNEIVCGPIFSSQLYQEHYARLSTCIFGILRTIDSKALRMVGIKDEVEQLLDISAWHKLLSVEELAYRDLTLEFLASFECRIGYNVWDDPLTIHFHLKGKVYHLSYIDLALLMGIYTPENTVTE